VLDAAHAAGVRYFDAARSYGRAEEFWASWLAERGIGPGEVTVGSKWGYEYTGGWRVDAERHEVKDLGVSALRRQLDETRGVLGSHLDLYQVHSATLESGVFEDDAVLGELEAVKETGVGRRSERHRCPPSRDYHAGTRDRLVRHRPGDLESARAFRV
jgi:aryl-alcohol dehydrogenase-like predicted oxidoreductase